MDEAGGRLTQQPWQENFPSLHVLALPVPSLFCLPAAWSADKKPL